MLKNALRLLILGVFVVGTIGIWEFFRSVNSAAGWFGGTTATSHAVVLQEIQALGKLELVRYNFKDIVEHEQIQQWLPNPKTVLIVQGMAVGCVDLTKMTLSDITSESETVVVHLPNPEICSYQIDHSKSKIYSTEYAFLGEAKLVDEAYQKAEAQIQQSALETGILVQTKKNAEQILKPLLEKITRKKVLLRYRMNAQLPAKR